MKNVLSLYDQELLLDGDDNDILVIKKSHKVGKKYFIFGDYYTAKEIARHLNLNYSYVQKRIKEGYLSYLENYEETEQKKRIEKSKLKKILKSKNKTRSSHNILSQEKEKVNVLSEEEDEESKLYWNSLLEEDSFNLEEY